MIVQKITVNLIPDDAVNVIHLNQYDKDAAALEFTILKGSSLFDLTGCAVRIEGTKPDGKGYSYDGTVSGSVAKFNVSEQMTAVAGKYRAEVRISKGSNDIGTANVVFDIEKAGLSEGTDISETELPAIIDMGRQNLAKTEASADEAKGYTNTAKGYSEAASASADRAAALTIRNI